MGQSLVLTTTMPALHGGKIKIRTKDDITHNIMVGNKVSISSVESKNSAEILCKKYVDEDLNNMYNEFGLLKWNSTNLKGNIDIITFDTDRLKEKKEKYCMQTDNCKDNGFSATYKLCLYNSSKSGLVLGIECEDFPVFKNIDDLIEDYQCNSKGVFISKRMNFIKKLMSSIKNKIIDFIRDENVYIALQRNININTAKVKDVYCPSAWINVVKDCMKYPNGLVYEIKVHNGTERNIVVVYPSVDFLKEALVSREIYPSEGNRSTIMQLIKQDISNIMLLKKNVNIKNDQEFNYEQVNSIEDYYENGRIV